MPLSFLTAPSIPTNFHGNPLVLHLKRASPIRYGANTPDPTVEILVIVVSSPWTKDLLGDGAGATDWFGRRGCESRDSWRGDGVVRRGERLDGDSEVGEGVH